MPWERERNVVLGEPKPPTSLSPAGGMDTHLSTWGLELATCRVSRCHPANLWDVITSQERTYGCQCHKHGLADLIPPGSERRTEQLRAKVAPDCDEALLLPSCRTLSTQYQLFLTEHTGVFSRQRLWNIADRNAVNRANVIPYFTCQRGMFDLHSLFLQHSILQKVSLARVALLYWQHLHCIGTLHKPYIFEGRTLVQFE